MIAFLPDDLYVGEASLPDFPHMTLVYAGVIQDRTPTEINDIAKDAISLSRLISSFSTPIMGLDVFGDEERVRVLTLHTTPQLYAARKLVERWNKSQYKEFRPHITLGPEETVVSVVPQKIHFSRIAACWGETRLIVPLEY